MKIQQPTSEQCSSGAVVFDQDGRIGYACWYPQMGGYVGRAVALFDKEWQQREDGATMGGCIDVLVWHDGDFPFHDGDEKPREIHHCDPEQFIEFGQFLQTINEKGKKPMVKP